MKLKTSSGHKPARNKSSPASYGAGPDKSFPEASLVGDEVLDWYRLSPAERFSESLRLWESFILLGGSYDSESDTQSPFHIFQA